MMKYHLEMSGCLEINLPTEQDQSDTEDVSSEEEMDIVSNRMRALTIFEEVGQGLHLGLVPSPQ